MKNEKVEDVKLVNEMGDVTGYYHRGGGGVLAGEVVVGTPTFRTMLRFLGLVASRTQKKRDKLEPYYLKLASKFSISLAS